MDISKIQRLYIFPEDIDKLYRKGGGEGGVSIAILCIEKVDFVVGILFIIPPLRFEEEEEEEEESGPVDSKGRRRDKMVERDG